MKKLSLLLVVLFLAVTGFAQEKENGKVYIEHPALQKVNQFWQAFVAGDKDAYTSFLADTVAIVRNGNFWRSPKENMAKGLDWWAKEFENLKVVTDTPAYADAILYDEGGLWVQDWLRIKATHTKSGINMDLRLHNLYSFNEDGKIASLHQYFNNDIFEAINTSGGTIENGEVYIQHPYIITVRKAVNAYAAKDAATLKTFYAEGARFSNSTMKWRESIGLDEVLAGWQGFWDKTEDIYLEQVGYPDCIYYAKNDEYNVYSWWILRTTMKESGKKIAAPIMLSISFDKEGKITRDMAYYSSNHFEE
ncbi:nuclear transport factor 2 family protein [Mangrovibacterium diazotrophicum]|uniref:SnoaL-like protein n=1 Tax=Mangrovibacterium diazotrophicum TaxID=1261403 RepID=A0A419W8R2_9BACT|nr:nuclear transport factor 2 family protein [Mangrovibacterium diazotrophicum]RKD91845.1 SnoaL-like protein [Mangrovibacterium diazotrophicum]